MNKTHFFCDTDNYLLFLLKYPQKKQRRIYMAIFYDFLGSVTKLGLEKLSQRNLPKTQGNIKLKGLKESVEIIRDEWGIPHIYAKNTEDLVFAQGLVHAQDRFWQMELNRRVATGTLSEVFGEGALEVDIAARTFGFARLGKADLKLLPKHLKQLLKCYVKGVNAYLKLHQHKLPVEFTLTQHQPKKWTLLDTMAFSRLMAWQLSHAWQSQLVRTQIEEKVGHAAAHEIDIRYSKENPSILTATGDVDKLCQSNLLKGTHHPLLQQNGGSNSWCISPAKSTTGHAILANDPHLTLSAPAIWYENHLNCPDFEVTGASIPGFPLVMIGHNTHISWGITLAFTDCEDLFLEKIRKNDKNLVQYLFKEKWRKATVIEEKYVVKGQEKPHIAQVISTHHGPIISEVIGETTHCFSLQSNALQVGQIFRSWWQLNQAKNWTDFVHAMSFMDAPQLNMIYADVKGNIGHWVTGKVPVRAKGDGRVLAEGWSGECEWIGNVPFKEMPHMYNPEKGYIITANNKAVTDDYPHYLGESWMNGYRAKRLEDLMAQKRKVSLLDCEQMQNDVHSVAAEGFVQLFQELYVELNQVRNKTYEKALHLLVSWDGQLTIDSSAASIYTLTKYQLIDLLFKELLGEELTKCFQGSGLQDPGLATTNEFSGHDTVTLLRLLNDTDSWWVNRIGGRVEVLKKSLMGAVEWLKNHFGHDHIHRWHWGALHRVVFKHAMSVKKPLDQAFNVGPLPIGGDHDTPLQTTASDRKVMNEGLISTSYRQIIDMGNLANSKAILPPGQSGHIGSEHYQDQVEAWLKGSARPMLWTREQVEVYKKTSLLLKPKIKVPKY